MSDLFKEFAAVDAKQWKAQVQAELKGEDFAQTLVFDTQEGFQVKPMYTHDDVENSEFLVEENHWKIVSDFLPHNAIDYSSVDGIQLNSSQLNEFYPTDNELIIATYKNELPNLKAINHNTFLDWDFLGDLAEFGNYPGKSQTEALASLHDLETSNYNNTLSIDIARYQNAGANHAEQLALMLLVANEYVELYESELILSNILVKTAVGNNFFFEIAKLRAMRILWANLCDAWHVNSHITIMAESSMRNKTVMDKHNNLIRTTYEAAAGIFGNVDLLHILPYDQLFEERKAMSLELAMKQQFVLREESFLNWFADPLKGSYYVEFLTAQLCKKAWDIFKRLESEGGFVVGLKSEKIQKMIEKSANEEQALFDAKELNLIGVNKYPKEKDDFVQYALKKYPKNNHQVLVKTIAPKRLSEGVEKDYVQN